MQCNAVRFLNAILCSMSGVSNALLVLLGIRECTCYSGLIQGFVETLQHCVRHLRAQ